MTPSMFLLFD